MQSFITRTSIAAFLSIPIVTAPPPSRLASSPHLLHLRSSLHDHTEFDASDNDSDSKNRNDSCHLWPHAIKMHSSLISELVDNTDSRTYLAHGFAYKTPCLTLRPRAGLLSSIMFLHALLFFLLGPSVFAAPVGSHVDGPEQFIGVWYPVVPCNPVSRMFSQVSGVSHLCHRGPERLWRFSLAV